MATNGARAARMRRKVSALARRCSHLFGSRWSHTTPELARYVQGGVLWWLEAVSNRVSTCSKSQPVVRVDYREADYREADYREGRSGLPRSGLPRRRTPLRSAKLLCLAEDDIRLDGCSLLLPLLDRPLLLARAAAQPLHLLTLPTGLHRLRRVADGDNSARVYGLLCAAPFFWRLPCVSPFCEPLRRFRLFLFTLFFILSRLGLSAHTPH